MLTVENLHAGYGDKRVLQDVTFAVAGGEFGPAGTQRLRQDNAAAGHAGYAQAAAGMRAPG